jgi:dCTP deaminase
LILTGRAIKRAVDCGDIIISPFLEQNLNPNSYTYCLGDELLQIESTGSELDTKSEFHSATRIEIPHEGLALDPGIVYLSHTVEIIGSAKYAMSLIGRSSVGRLGLFVQVDADLGHIGSTHRWTLELVATQQVLIYPGMRIGQVCFWTSAGDPDEYEGPYGAAHVPVPARAESFFDPRT